MNEALKAYAEIMALEYFLPEMRGLKIEEKFKYKEAEGAVIYAAKRKTKNLTVYVIGLFPDVGMSSMIVYSKEWKVLALTASKETFYSSDRELKFLEDEWKKISNMFSQFDKIINAVIGVAEMTDEELAAESCEFAMKVHGHEMDKN